MIEKGNEIEKRYGLKLLCQMSFDKKVSLDIQEDAAFLNVLEDLKLSESLGELVNTIFWNMKTNEDSFIQEQQHQQQQNGGNAGDGPSNGVGPSGGEGEGSGGGKHIMISYNSASRALCLTIKSYLESIGHRVWIDVSNIHGASLDAMAKAVEGERSFHDD